MGILDRVERRNRLTPGHVRMNRSRRPAPGSSPRSQPLRQGAPAILKRADGFALGPPTAARARPSTSEAATQKEGAQPSAGCAHDIGKAQGKGSSPTTDRRCGPAVSVRRGRAAQSAEGIPGVLGCGASNARDCLRASQALGLNGWRPSPVDKEAVNTERLPSSVCVVARQRSEGSKPLS